MKRKLSSQASTSKRPARPSLDDVIECPHARFETPHYDSVSEVVDAVFEKVDGVDEAALTVKATKHFAEMEGCMSVRELCFLMDEFTPDEILPDREHLK